MRTGPEDRKSARPPFSGIRFAALLLVVAGAVLATFAASAPSIPRSVRMPRMPRPRLVPRLAQNFPEIMRLGPHTGVCDTCHTSHGIGDDGFPRLLKRANDNRLCDACHQTELVPEAGGSYGGSRSYLVSAHGSSVAMLWPGPEPQTRAAEDVNKCLNCHDPHGWKDGNGSIPHLAVSREEDLCTPCHDGSPAATDIESDLNKLWAHPTLSVGGIHTGPDETRPGDFSAAPQNYRHAECVDCHNPHVARADRSAPIPPDASKRLLGVSRIAVSNGGAGSIPGYTFIAGSDTLTTPVTEYQLCFKCHSSWTVQPIGQSDLARLVNPNNPSYHPIEATGADPNILTGAFTSGWSASSLTACGDCHGSDDGRASGPHGSTNRYILKKPYDPSSASRAVQSTEACFDCHAFAVYGDSTTAEAVLENSRFNSSTLNGRYNGHAHHSSENVPCSACHETHGSTSKPHLIVTGRVPGISSITLTAGGGTCTPTCHSAQAYTQNYAQ